MSVQLQELRPDHPRLAALRGALQVVATQDVPYRDRVDAVPQVRQGTLDAAIAPSRILLGHADDELLDLLGNSWPSRLSALLTSIKLLNDEAAVPPQEGVRRGNCSHRC
jgi:hypothetical protein